MEINKTYTFICPECFNTIQFKTGERIRMHSVEHNFGTSHIIPKSTDKYICTGLKFDVECTNCTTCMFECDDTIAGRIVTLNKICGLETIYCCGGHVPSALINSDESDAYSGYSLPYVMFKFSAKMLSSLIALLRRNMSIIHNFDVSLRIMLDEKEDYTGMFHMDFNNKSFNEIIDELYRYQEDSNVDAISISIHGDDELPNDEQMMIYQAEMDIFLSELIKASMTYYNIHTDPIQEIKTLHTNISKSKPSIDFFEDDDGRVVFITSMQDTWNAKHRGRRLTTIIEYGKKRVTIPHELVSGFDIMRYTYFPDWERRVMHYSEIPSFKNFDKEKWRKRINEAY